MTEAMDNQGAGEAGGLAEIVVSGAGEGERVDRFLSDRFPRLSRAFFQRCIREGRITINDAACRTADRLHPNDRVGIDWPPKQQVQLEPEEVPLDVLYEDDDVLVINKQPGLVIHPTNTCHRGTLVQALLHHDEESFAELVDEDMRPGIVHRLDKDTSGVMVVAKNDEARRNLKDSFKERDVEKTYLAIVHGEFGRVAGTVTGDIGRHPVRRTKMAVVDEGGKRAVTHYRLLGTANGCSLLEVRIETGRTHQIRVHFAHLNHPIIGDAVYGGKQRGGGARPKRQMLHAWKLVFPHPRTGQKREYMAPVPDDFCEALKALALPLVAGCVP